MDFKPVVSVGDTDTRAPKQKRRYTCKRTQQEYIKRWRASNLSQSNFCRQHNLNPKCLSRWLSAKAVHPNELTPALIPSDAGQLRIDAIEIKLAGDANIQITGNLTVNLLKQLLSEVIVCK
jgi:hypothetical protein